MFDIDAIARDADELRAQVGRALGLDLTPELVVKLYEAAMGPETMEVYRVVTFFGHEADKCRQSGAWFLACLMIASAIEGLLTALAIHSQGQVEATKTYRSIEQDGTYRECILRMTFDKSIQLAATLGWVPSDTVAPDLLSATIADFPFVRKNLYPREDQAARAAKLEAFKRNPGIEMLWMLQHLRNLVHPNRWPRFQITITSPEFESDCKFIFVIAYQVMMCLLETFTRLSRQSTSELETLSAGLSAQERQVLGKLALNVLSPDRGV